MTPSRIVPLLLLVASCSPAPATLTEEERGAVEADVRAASMALVGALNEHDAPAILAFYGLNDDFTQVACTDFVYGAKAFENLTRSLHANFSDAVYDMAIQGVRVLGPDAAVVSLQGTMLAPLFVTRVLHRSDGGRWLVVWEHESWPGCAGPTPAHPGTGPGDLSEEAGTGEIP